MGKVLFTFSRWPATSLSHHRRLLSVLSAQLQRVAFGSARRLVNFSSQFQLRPHQSVWTKPVLDKVNYIKRELATRFLVDTVELSYNVVVGHSVAVVGWEYEVSWREMTSTVDRSWRLNEISACSFLFLLTELSFQQNCEGILVYVCKICEVAMVVLGFQ